MDATHERIAYRCLPMVIANQIGWDLLCPVDFMAVWDGGDGKVSRRFQFRDAETSYMISHFGYGILTFSISYLSRTSPGHNLWCKGPANDPEGGIAPLEGIIETDWSPCTFTMNWKFTRKAHAVWFKQGEPIATLLPFPRGYLNGFDPVIRPSAANPELDRDYRTWCEARLKFNQDLNVEAFDARALKWQKAYTLCRGVREETFAGHESKLKLAAFRKKG